MVDVFTWAGTGLSAGNLTTTSAGTGDTAPTGINGTTPTIVTTGNRAPRIRFLGSPTSTQSVAYWDFTAQTQGGFRFAWTAPPAPPASGTFPIIFQINSGATMQFYIDVTSTRRFNLRDGAGVLQQSATDAWVEGASYRLEATVDHGTRAVNVRIFTGDATTHSVQLSGMSTVLGASHSRAYFGKVNAVAVGEMYVDDILGTNTAAYPGPAVTAPSTPDRVWNGSAWVPDVPELVWTGTVWK